MDSRTGKLIIESGNTALGIEFGSTRIKAVLISPDGMVLAEGSCVWENRFDDGVWTYHLDDVWVGIQDCYRALSVGVQNKYGIPLTGFKAMGLFAMMHGYMAFDEEFT